MLLALLFAAQSAPHAAPAACPTPAVPRDMAGWSNTARAAVATTVAARARTLPLGSAVRATLAPAARVDFVTPPGKAVDGYGGLFAIAIPTAGRYRIALGAGAWVDLVRDGRALASVAHGHGPDCSGIRKMVDFDLQPGRYLVQIASNARPTLTVMAVRR